MASTDIELPLLQQAPDLVRSTRWSIPERQLDGRVAELGVTNRLVYRTLEGHTHY